MGIVENFFIYIGWEWDVELNLYYYWLCYYDVSIGCFIIKDIVWGVRGEYQSLNCYIYVENNLVNFVDLEGKFLQGIVISLFF